jgi:type II secretory pathway component PulC
MRLAVIASSFTLLCACGGAPPPVESPTTPPTKSPAPTVATVRTSGTDVAANALRRSRVREVLAAGPGAFLQHLALEDNPVLVGGKFHGFRIASLRDQAWWGGVDLKPGDVVTSVNGFSIEHPEEALEAFRSLDVSSELRIAYERDGSPRELRYAIVDDAPPRTGANPPRTEVH